MNGKTEVESGETKKPSLSVVITSYNDGGHLPACLSSLQAAAAGIEAEVIVVDNHSEDGSVELIQSSFPWVRLIRNDENFGYSRANNAGYRESQGGFILFL
ncbi:MAG: glycosyltransferase, partial [Acidobacteriota bacterium]